MDIYGKDYSESGDNTGMVILEDLRSLQTHLTSCRTIVDALSASKARRSASNGALPADPSADANVRDIASLFQVVADMSQEVEKGTVSHAFILSLWGRAAEDRLQAILAPVAPAKTGAELAEMVKEAATMWTSCFDMREPTRMLPGPLFEVLDTQDRRRGSLLILHFGAEGF